MKMDKKRLSELPLGAVGVVRELCPGGAFRRRLLDVGLCPGSRVRCVGHSPLGDPRAYLVRGTEIAIRQLDAESIIIE